MKRLLLSTLALFTVFVGITTAVDPVLSPQISEVVWLQIEKQQLINKDPNDNDVSELMARLVIITNDRELKPEALRRTIIMANSPKSGFGMIRNDGLKWLLSTYVLSSYNRQMYIRELKNRIDEQDKQIQELLRRTSIQTEPNKQPPTK